MDIYDFCTAHREEISALIRKRCEALREPITRYVADEIACIIADEPPVYEHIDNGCPWDQSGEIRKTGETFSPSSRFTAFLQSPTGRSLPTFRPGWGMAYPTWRDVLAYDGFTDRGINSIVESAAMDVLQDYVSANFHGETDSDYNWTETLASIFYDDYADFGFRLADELLPDEFEDCTDTVGDFAERYGSGIVYADIEDIPTP